MDNARGWQPANGRGIKITTGQVIAPVKAGEGMCLHDVIVLSLVTPNNQEIAALQSGVELDIGLRIGCHGPCEGNKEQ